MTRQEILMNAKPILFNTDMVRAILDGRKTVTRRAIKGELKIDEDSEIPMYYPEKGRMLKGRRYEGVGYQGGIEHFIEEEAPYHPGDILYVRETWNIANMWSDGNEVTFIYRGDKSEEDSARTISVSDDAFDKYGEMMYSNRPEWRPSIHMPKEAARIFLKVTNVRVERLQEITWQEATREGCYGGTGNEPDPLFHLPTLRGEFQKLWNSTIKKSDIDRYGWDANPWVWVIEFEMINIDD